MRNCCSLMTYKSTLVTAKMEALWGRGSTIPISPKILPSENLLDCNALNLYRSRSFFGDVHHTADLTGA